MNRKHASGFAGVFLTALACYEAFFRPFFCVWLLARLTSLLLMLLISYFSLKNRSVLWIRKYKNY